MKNLKRRLLSEYGYFAHDIKSIWSAYGIVGSILLSVLVSPAWILGFILSASGWYEITDSQS